MKKIYALLFKKYSIVVFGLLLSLIPSSIIIAQTVVPYGTPGSYTFTVPAGVYSMTVSTWGAGGAGGGISGYPKAGGGGEGGSFVRGTIDVIPGQTYTVVVGNGGNGANNTNGTAGEASSVSLGVTKLFNAIGGAGGALGNSFGAGGNSASTGNIVNGTSTSNFYGGIGGTATNASSASSGGGGGSAGAGGNGGNGGVVTAGTAGVGAGTPADAGAAGGVGRGSANDGNGNNGAAYGAGGSGGRDANSSTPNIYKGGDGGDGRINISYATPVNYRDAWISMNTGAATWCAGETRNITVTVKNVGTSTWTDASPDINIGVKWNTNGTNWADYYVRVDAGNLAPGATQTYTLPITASNNAGGGYTTPLAAGTNNLTFDIVEEGVSWFGNNNGNTGPGNVVYTSPNQTILALPGSPTGVASQSFCAINNPTVANIAATYTAGNTLKWYDAATGGTLVPNATSLVNGTTYYASQTNTSGCESSGRFAVTVTVGNPAAPTSAGFQSFCTINSPKVADLNATGTAIKWYTTSTGGTALATTTALATGTYYASQTVSGCESATRLTVPVTVGNPAAPTSAGVQTFCTINSPTVADLNATGTAIKWYTASTGGAALATTTALATGTYYASQTVSGCESATRLNVPVTVANPAAPTGAVSQSFCTINNPTVANLVAIGSSIQWYASATGGTALASTNALVNGTHYYASQTVGVCESATRLNVTVTVANPAAPTGSPAQSFCTINNPKVSNLIATGTAIKWYAASNGGTALATTTVLIDGTHYYASQTLGSCESATRLDVTVTVADPAAPTGSAAQSFCAINTPTVADLIATGTTIQWYAAPTGGAALASTIALVNGNHYYASQTIGSCESATRFDVTVTVDNPAAPSGTSPQLFCADANPTVADLTATGTAIQWYAAASGGTALASSTALVSGTHYYASQTVGSCESATRLNVTATIYQPPVITTDPGPSSQIACATSNISYSVVAIGTGLTYQWLRNGSSISNGGRISGATSSTLTITGLTTADNGDYSVVVSGTSPCNPATSASATLIVNQKIFFTTQPVSPQTICEGQPYTIFAQATGAITIYEWHKNGSAAVYSTGTFDGIDKFTLTIPNVTPADAGTYRLLLDDGTNVGCSLANSFIATLVVNPTPTATISGSITVCQSSTPAPLITFTNPQALPVTITYNINNGTNTTKNVAANSTATVAAPTTIAGTFDYNLVSVAYQSGPGCSNAITGTATVIVNPTPTVTAKTAVICSGSVFTVTPVDGVGGDIIPAGTTYSWSAPTVTGGLTGGVSGVNAANISGTLTNPTSAIQTATYTITPKTGTCAGITFTVTVTVNPTPVLSSSLTPPAICNNTLFNYAPTSATTGTTFNWSRAVVAGISNLAASGTNNPNETLINTTTDPISVVYVYTLSANSCSNSQNVTVTVNPTPLLSSSLTPPARCSNVSTTYTASSATSGVTYSWTRAVVAGISNAAGSGNTAAITETLVNTTANPINVVYAITLTANGCSNTQNVTVTVNPSPVLSSSLTPPAICNNTLFSYAPASATTGVTFNWSRAVVAGISNAAASGTDNPNETLINTTAAPVNVVYVYTLNANSCSNTQNVTVTVNPTPVLSSSLTPPARCSNVSTTYTATSLTSGVTYSWTRAVVAGISNAAGSGNTAAITETLVNTTANPINVVYAITLTANTCSNTQNVTVTVNPSAILSSSLTPPAICNNTVFSYTPTSATTGVTFNWSRAVVAGISNVAASGTNNPNETIVNTTTAPISVTYVYTLSANGCSNTQNVVVVVNPTPKLSSSLTPPAICNNTVFSYSPASATTGVTFNWSRAVVAGISNLAASGTDNPNETLNNTTTGPISVVYVYILSANSCSNTQNVTVIVNPTPVLSSSLTPPARCSNVLTTYTAASATSGVTYSWTRAVVAGISNAAGSGNTAAITETLVNTTANPINVVYAITLTANGCSNTQNVTVTVNPSPVASAGPAIVSCTVPITMTGASASGTFGSIGWSGGAGLGTFSGSGTDPSTYVFTPSVSQGSFTATLTVFGSAPCNGTNATSTRTITWGFTGAWLGVTSTDWFTPSNWCGGVPTATSDVTIPAVGSVPNQPIINAAGAVCRSITLNGTLSTTAPNNLDVYGDWINNGTFTNNTGSVTFKGGSNNSLAGSSTTTFYNLIINKDATANTLTSNTKAFVVNNNLTVSQGNLILQAVDNDYTVTGDVIVPAPGILTHSVNWDVVGKRLFVGGNITIDGIFNYTVRSTVNMIGTGTNKTVKTGANPLSGFSIFLLNYGNFYANGPLLVNDNFWAMFGTAGTFHTNGQTVTAASALLNAGGTVYVDGGILNVTGGIVVGNGTAGTLNFSSGIINTDGITIGSGAAGTFTCTNSPVINITGNWTNNGTFTPATSQVNFIGSAAQTIGGTASTTFNNLNIANAAGITLGANSNVNAILNLSSGLVTTGANVITVGAAGNITNASASTYINGKLGWIYNAISSKIFPVGKGGNYRPVTFAYSSLTGTSTVIVDQIEGNIGTPVAPTVGFTARYWNITQSGGTNFNYKVTLNDPAYSPIGFAKILKREGTGANPINAFDATAPNYTNVTGFTTFNGSNAGTNSFSLGHDCSSTANAGAALAGICQYGTSAPLGGSITGTATGGVWTDGGVGGTFTPDATSLNASWTPPAAYYGLATLTLTPTGGLCNPNYTSSKTQNVIQGPSGNFTASATTVCAGTSVIFTFSTANLGSYIFKVGGLTVQTGTTNVYSTSSLTNGASVTVDVANGNNCGKTFGPIVINVNPAPIATLTSDKASICPGDMITFTAGTVVAGNSYTFKLNGSSVQSGSSNIYSTTTFTAANNPVTVDVTNSNGCVATSAPVSVTVNSLPAGTLTSTATSICAGGSVTFTATAGAGNTYNFKVNGVSAQGPSASNTFTTTTLTNPSVVTVDVTNTSGCTTTFNAIAVTVNPLPTGTLTAAENSGGQNDNSICANSPVTFTATSGYSNYAFYLRGTGTALYNGPLSVYTTSTLVDNDYLTVVVTSGSNCTATFTSPSITVVPSPLGTLTVSPSSTICAGDNVTFTATADPTFTNYLFKLNGSTILQNGPGNTFSTTGLVQGDVVTVVVTNTNTCTTTFNSITMTVNPLPTGTLVAVENDGIANDGIICFGTSVIFTVTPTGYSNYNFIKNNVSVQSGSSNTYTTSSLISGDNITVAVTNGGGCIGLLNTIPITVNPLPVVSAIADGAPSVCLNSSTPAFTDATAGGTWSVTNGTGSASISPVGVASGLTAGTVTINYTFTNGNGCTSIVTTTLTVNAPPAVTPITGNVNVCTGTTSQFSDATTGVTNVWSSDNTAVATVDAAGLVSGVMAGPANISYTVTDANGCSTTVSIHIIVTDLPYVAPITTIATSGFNVCEGGTIPLNDATSGGTWSSSDMSVATISATGIVSGITSGTTEISYSITTSCGQNAVAKQVVTVNAPPTATISYNSGNPFCTTAGPVSVIQTGTTGGTYSSTGSLSIDPSTGTITPGATGGTYTITYTVAASGGCAIYTTTTTVTITTAPSATIIYNSTPYCKSSGPVTVTRTGTAGGTYTSTAGLSIDGTTGTITPASSTAGSYTVTYTIGAAGGCALFSTTASVTITATPSATISYNGSPYCTSVANAPVTFSGTSGGTYSSTAGLTINSGTGNITPSTSTGGTYTITYTVAASGGCSVYTTTTSVTITAAPTSVAGTPVTTCSNNPPVNVTAGSSASNYISVLWSSNGTGTFANANSLTLATYAPSAADISAGTVTLTLTANGNAGCATAATSTKILTISAPPAAPTITPASATVCQGDILPLSAGTSSTTGSVTLSSGVLNFTIPDYSLEGANNSISVSGIPVGAVINNVSVNFNITHTYDRDLIINLKAPNNNILNLVDLRGGSGNNFTNTTVSSLSSNPFTNSRFAPPFTGTYAADGDLNVYGASSVGEPNVTLFSDLFATPNGNWTMSMVDVGVGGIGTFKNWSITINYTVPATSTPVTWSPATDLYTDAGATNPYTGQLLATVYTKPSTPTNRTYTATATNGNGCTNFSTVAINVNPSPVVTITADYCVVGGKVQLTATSTPAATSYIWSTGETTQIILVDVAGTYKVTGFYATGCSGKAIITVANELVVNGDFETGGLSPQTTAGLGFTSDYLFLPDVAGNNELVYDGENHGYSITPSGQNVHNNFWGYDHTTGNNTGNFMAVNGHGNTLVVWKETVNVLPNTKYYFSAWGMSLNNVGPFAQLQFSVNGSLVGTAPVLPAGVNSNNNGYTGTAVWTRFYGTWTSGPTTTSADIYINDLQAAYGGNDFGLDDISFGTLSTFINLQSAPGTDAQTLCINTAITPIVYSVGSGSAPTITPALPAGLSSTFNGILFTISGTPTVAGNYAYTITTTGTCKPSTATGTINVQEQKITLSSGASSPSVCVNTPVNIGFTLSGTATNATISGPASAFLTGAVSGSGPSYTYTVSGTPATAGSYAYIITTSGTCSPVTFSGTITVTAQTITLNTANNVQTKCINTAIDNIQYTIGGTGTGVMLPVAGLPAGVSGTYNSGILFISGTPTVSGTFNYTVTTSGTCAAAMATGTITVTPNGSLSLTSVSGTDGQTLCANTALTDITYSVNNATGASATGLPTGVNGIFNAGVFTISGTAPATAGTYNYTITTSGGCGTGTATGNFTVQSETINLTSGNTSPTICINQSMIPIVYTIGGTATGASITGQPVGVNGVLSGNTFTISGVPTGAGPFNYTITLTGSCATTVTSTGTITVTAAAFGGNLTSVSLCNPTSGTLTLSGQSGTIIRWEYSDDGGATWISIVNTTISQAYPSLPSSRMYRVRVGNNCGDVYSTVALVGIHNLWTGANSSDWNTASNWSDNLVPSISCPTVTIPVVPTNRYPVLSTGPQSTINNLQINANSSLIVAGNTLQIAGGITNAGILDATAGTIEFNGASDQFTIGSIFKNNTIQNLIVSSGGTNGLTLNGGLFTDTLKITGTLSFGNVNAKLISNDHITLVSTADATANVGVVAAGNTITGNFTVERYIPALKSWRFMAVNTQPGQYIHDAWQEGETTNKTNGIARRGISIPGEMAGFAALGFDLKSGAPAMKWYDPNTDKYVGITSTLAPFDTARGGYLTFIRGDRSANATNSPVTYTTLRTTGKLFTGKMPDISVKPNKFQPVNNPFAASIDLSKIMQASPNKPSIFFYVYDPRLGSGLPYTYGAFQTIYWNIPTGTWLVQPGGGSYAAPYNSDPKLIQSGQAFWVSSTTVTEALPLDESKKSVGSTGGMLFRAQGPDEGGKFAQLRTSLYVSSANPILVDGTLQQISQDYVNTVDGMDAKKLVNPAENLSIKTSNKLLVIERRAPFTSQDTVYYNVTGLHAQNYQFQFDAQGLSTFGKEGWVEDTYVHTKTPLNLEGTTSVDFSVTNVAGTYASDRFRIVFQAAAGPLPVTIVSVKATQKDADIAVEWKVDNQSNMKEYQIEKSLDGNRFNNAGTIPANGNAASVYTFLDKNAPAGYNYYRIRSIGKDGQQTVTQIVRVLIQRGTPEITIHPNPITNGVINLHLINEPAGMYGIRLLNPLGQTIVSRQVSHAEGTSTEQIEWNYNLAHGVYQLEVTRPDASVKVIKVMY